MNFITISVTYTKLILGKKPLGLNLFQKKITKFNMFK